MEWFTGTGSFYRWLTGGTGPVPVNRGEPVRNRYLYQCAGEILHRALHFASLLHRILIIAEEARGAV